MSGPLKKKLCWNCDASVPLESENCLYCGVAIASPISQEGEDEEEPKVALPPPLYGKPTPRSSLSAAPSPQSAMNKKRMPPPQPAFRGKPTMKIREEALEPKQEAFAIQKHSNTILSLFLLLAGSTFFLFGLMVLLFSDQGALVLSWKRDQAIVYLGLGCLLLLGGWRFISRIEE